jgi:hypothetical protein
LEFNAPLRGALFVGVAGDLFLCGCSSFKIFCKTFLVYGVCSVPADEFIVNRLFGGVHDSFYKIIELFYSFMVCFRYEYA